MPGGRRMKSGRKYGWEFKRNVEILDADGTVQNQESELDFDLDFETSEVFDIARIMGWLSLAVQQSTDTSYTVKHALNELQNPANLSDSNIEGDSGIVYYDEHTFATSIVTEGNVDAPQRFFQLDFFDWYTIAQNPIHQVRDEGGLTNGSDLRAVLIIQGRRRRANREEYFNLLNQLRR